MRTITIIRLNYNMLFQNSMKVKSFKWNVVIILSNVCDVKLYIFNNDHLIIYFSLFSLQKINIEIAFHNKENISVYIP